MIRIERVGRAAGGAEKAKTFAEGGVEFPDVVSRIETRSGDGSSEIATSYRPTAGRPPTFPADLPFIRHVESHTNEYPGTSRRARVRWVTASDPQRVFDDATHQSVASGWRIDPSYEPPAFHSAVRTCFLRRDDHIRRIAQFEFEGTSIIDLEDVPRRVP